MTPNDAEPGTTARRAPRPLQPRPVSPALAPGTDYASENCGWFATRVALLARGVTR